MGGLDDSPQVVFWCFRPKVPLAHQREHLLWDQRVNEPVMIRELFKGAYAPTSSRRFHPELGTLQMSSFQSQGPSSADHSRPTLSHLPLASCLSMAWETSSADNDSPVNDISSLLAHMSHQGTSFKKIPVCQVSRLNHWDQTLETRRGAGVHRADNALSHLGPVVTVSPLDLSNLLRWRFRRQ